jgi:hypothetical protein
MATDGPTDAHHDWVLAVSGQDPRDWERGWTPEQIAAAQQARLTARLTPLVQQASGMDPAIKDIARAAVLAVKSNDPQAVQRIAELEAATGGAAPAAPQANPQTKAAPPPPAAPAPQAAPAASPADDAAALFADLAAAKPGDNLSVLHKRINARFAYDPMGMGQVNRLLVYLTRPGVQSDHDRAATIDGLRHYFPGVKTPQEKAADDRVVKAIELAGAKLGPAVGDKLKALASPASVAILIGFVGLFVLAELTPLGWIANGVAFLASASLAAVELQGIIDDIRAFLTLARSPNGDLDEAAEHLAHAVSAVGVDLVLAIVLHKGGQAAKPYIKPPNGYVDMVTPDGMIVRVPADVARSGGRGGPPPNTMQMEGDAERGGGDDDAGGPGDRPPTLRNQHLAGKTHPVTGIPFDAQGYPDFSSVAVKTVKIEQTGTRGGDFRAANRLAGLQKTPRGYTWHHHQDGVTMQLVPRDIHQQTGHTGGFKEGPYDD